MTVVIVQCRLSSTRLPEKALLKLRDAPLLSWTLNAMKKVQADEYYLACDTDSEEKLFPIAKSCGWKAFSGPRDDVLKRFCLVIEKTNADIVVRATADNPFLFYDAAQDLLNIYKDKYFSDYDYITYTGLPHGSGIEIFNGKSLLKAKELTTLPYDHEHVGPSLYNHPETFKSLFLPSPEKYNAPQLRTTIDNFADYKRAEAIMDLYPNQNSFTSEEILKAFEKPYIKNQILFVPSVKKGRGTGHLKRCLTLAKRLNAYILIPESHTLIETEDVVRSSKINTRQIITKYPSSGEKEYSLIVTDLFKMESDELALLLKAGPIVSLDEGSVLDNQIDYLLDIIPSYNLKRKANLSEPELIEIPQNKKTNSIKNKKNEDLSALVCIGGEDPSSLSVKSAVALAMQNINVKVISSKVEKLKTEIPENLKDRISVTPSVENLKEELYKYDIVVTHYGLTSYEAQSAGCCVILVSTSSLHYKLAKKYGFVCLKKSQVNKNGFEKAIENYKKLQSSINVDSLEGVTDFAQTVTSNPLHSSKLHSTQTMASSSAIPSVSKDASTLISQLAEGQTNTCPICTGIKTTPHNNPVIARTPTHTFRRCSVCQMIYLSYSTDSASVKYNKAYFADDYKKQYGHTYLEDFDSIKAQGLRRMKNIVSVAKSAKIQCAQSKSATLKNEHATLKYEDVALKPAILDIGCAYGPFLSAASDFSWNVYGSDIAEDAIKYVNETLKYKAVKASFADFDSQKEFGFEKFDAISMWYVIEHIKNLSKVLIDINQKLKDGGIFALGTPCASGVSGRFNRQSFFEQSPKDHYTIWEIKNVKKYLKPFGFKVVKIVSTGHHPERMPIVKKLGSKKGDFFFSLMMAVSKLFKLGDTFEIYCKKIQDVK